MAIGSRGATKSFASATTTTTTTMDAPKKVERRGRPKGSKNKPKVGPDGQIILPASASKKSSSTISAPVAAAPTGTSKGSKKRAAVEEAPPPPPVKVERRGRPKGSKNRPKEVIPAPEVSKAPGELSFPQGTKRLRTWKEKVTVLTLPSPNTILFFVFSVKDEACQGLGLFLFFPPSLVSRIYFVFLSYYRERKRARYSSLHRDSHTARYFYHYYYTVLLFFPLFLSCPLIAQYAAAPTTTSTTVTIQDLSFIFSPLSRKGSLCDKLYMARGA